MIYYKEIENNGEKLVFLCDKDLYGKKIKDGNIVLDINDFYIGKEVNDIEIDENIKSIMAIGEKSIKLLIKKKILKKEDLKNIKYIQGIPYIFIIYI